MDSAGTISLAEHIGGMQYTDALSPIPGIIQQDISSALDVDMFSFDVFAGDRIRFDIDGPGSPFLPTLKSPLVLRIFDSMGRALSENSGGSAPDDIVGNSNEAFTEYTFETGGTYFAGVSSRLNNKYDPITGLSTNDAIPSIDPTAYKLIILDANPPTIRIHDLSKPESTKEQQQDFFIETSFNDVYMPSLRIQLDNLPFGINPKELSVHWGINIRSYSLEKGSFFSNTSYEASYDEYFSFSSNSAEIKPEFNKIVGGYLNVNALFSFRGKTYFLFPVFSVAVPRDLRILGRNPSVEQVQSFIDRLIPAKGLMPKDSPLSYGDILKKIARHETNNPSRFGLSGYNQFYSIGDYKGLPTWSTNNDGGVGIMQITRSITNVPYIWDWRENIKAGARQLDYGLKTTRRLKDVISSHQGYLSALGNAFKDREKKKLPILNEIEFPDLNPLQFIQNAIRIYNGVGGGPDSIGRNILHEWEVKTEGSPNMLDLRVSKITPDPKRPKKVKYIGKVQWVRVSSARRYNRAGKPIGEPDYVNRVMNA